MVHGLYRVEYCVDTVFADSAHCVSVVHVSDQTCFFIQHRVAVGVTPTCSVLCVTVAIGVCPYHIA